VISKILLLMEIEFIVARILARGFIPAKYSESMVRLQGGLPPHRKKEHKLALEGIMDAMV